MVGRAWRSKLVGIAHLSGPAPGPNPEAEPGGCRRGLCSDTGPPHSLPHSAPPTSNPVQHSSLQGVYLLGSKSHWEGVWKMCFSFQASLGRHSKGCVPQTLTCVCHEACRGLMPKCCGVIESCPPRRHLECPLRVSGGGNSTSWLGVRLVFISITFLFLSPIILGTYREYTGALGPLHTGSFKPLTVWT